jgi:ATP phosphoribosyltransferase
MTQCPMATPMRLKIAVQKSGRLTDSSLDLLSRCGLKYSRGKDQLMCYGENMPLDVLFVRDDDIPDLVQEDVCDLGLVGLNVIEEKRLAFEARGIAPLFETVQLLDFGRCKLCIAVPDGFDYRGAESLRASASRPPIRTSWALSRRARHRTPRWWCCRVGRNRAAPGPRGFDLRSGVHRLDAGRESLRQAHTVLESQAALIRTPGADPRRKAGMDPPPVDAHRRRRTGQGQQVHHAARAALGAAGDREAPARQRGADGHSARGRAIGWPCTPCAAKTCSGRRSSSLKSAGASSVLVLPVEKMLA